ncbi:TetR family transcriptional regulator [Rhodococcus sp. IEGM 1379]|uniref:TetR family transcriptional regulator n=1 Tax=Rhodococcus sp. IEGM 1379 TaxID=3047086 RepID=UPI0024B85B11|nr:TetR family transcriptional regulator [Rhodococcus sp. IEGM 1379]MDI9913833.1 TetR family transcriptional regulator [Rhodococcus sp. IEGM 1379]
MSDRGTETREKLVETALRLFRDEGFQATTMRRIAGEAGVSLGNTYYYFAGKDELVSELYVVIQRDHRALALPQLRDGGSLEENLKTVLHAGLDVMSPYHGFGSSFLQIALPSTSRSSPFSVESTDAREMAIDLMRQVLTASKQRTPPSLEKQLPTLLWLTYLGVTLHWVTDSSPGQTCTRTLVNGVVPVVAKAIKLARLPVARGLVGDIAKLITNTPASEQVTVR